MQEQLKAVEEFHNAFGELNGEEPCLISESQFMLRKSLIDEESSEYLEACWSGSIVDIADALGDQLYILCGTILKHGLQHKIEEVFKEIQRSNMSKLDIDGKAIINGYNGIDDKTRPIGKILKGPNYSPPNITAIL